MHPADIYAALMQHPVQAPDAHAVACILAVALWEAGEAGCPVTETTGLSGDDLGDLAAGFFPQARALFAGLQGLPQPQAGADEACLRDLLRRGTTAGTLLELRLADMLARRSLRSNHLWQDLGLRHRDELSALMTRHFAPLARRNSADMKWKKFFYRTLCRDEGAMLCAAPSCAECDDFEGCFGDESGESLLARARRAADLVA
jgi:nitrogen fixation protein NifQ